MGTTGRVVLVLVLGVAAAWAPAAAGWQFGNAPATNPGVLPPDLSSGRGPSDTEPYGTREMQARQLKRMREQHQKQMVLDIDRLVQLATALKAETGKGDGAGADALKNVDEIGRLAKKVTELIKNE